MNRHSFLLSNDEQERISIDDLARLALRVLQRDFAMVAQGQFVAHGAGSLDNILAFVLVERSLTGPDKKLRDKYAQAVDKLYHDRYIRPDPDQRSNSFCVLTDKGERADTSLPLVGLSDTTDFISFIESKTGSPLDTVVVQYLEESWRAAEAELWLSSLFMLGGASERLLWVLSLHVDYLRADAAQSARLAGLWQVRRRKEWIVDQLPDLRRSHSGYAAAFTDVDDIFDWLFTTYRYLRNDVGHPRETPLNVNPEQVKALLTSFHLYADAVHSILAIR